MFELSYEGDNMSVGGDEDDYAEEYIHQGARYSTDFEQMKNSSSLKKLKPTIIENELENNKKPVLLNNFNKEN